MSQNGVIQPLLTDFYQISMAYAYWDNKKMNDHAVFDLFFRKNPFKGEFTIFAGLSECINYVKNFKFSEDDIEYLVKVMPESTDPEFFTFLKNLTTNEVTISAIPEGTVVFAKVPLIRVEGPLAVVQLLETTLLNLVNFASLVATNAARFRHASGEDKLLLEFGLRRAQGPDGGLSASKYCYLGGFDGTSDVLAAKKFNIPVKGTHAHAFVSSFHKADDVSQFHKLLNKNSQQNESLLPTVEEKLQEVADIFKISKDQVNQGELMAFTAYASSFPSYFLALIDTYDTLKSGCINFLAVVLALKDFGYQSIGVRIDSGDLAYLSKELRKMFTKLSESLNIDWIANLSITASNDINEETLYSLEQQGHSINAFGIGTHLVTCQKQPALGCVFKLVELNGDPRMKLSQDIAKVTIPGKKNIYRLYGHDGLALLDLLTKADEKAPGIEERVLCQHPIQGAKRAYVKPKVIESLLKVYWKNGKIETPLDDLEGCRQVVKKSLATIRQDHKRALNPTPYKVSVTTELFQFMHNLWMDCAPISELS